MPAPEVYGRHCFRTATSSWWKMPYVSFRRYLQKQNYPSGPSWYHGETGPGFCKLHQLSFPSFGNVMAGNKLIPRVTILLQIRRVLQMHLNMADKGTFAPGELAEVEQFFSVKLKELEDLK